MSANAASHPSLFNSFYRAMILPGIALFLITGYIGLTSPAQPHPDPNLPTGFSLWVRLAGAFLIGPISIALGWLITRKFKDNLTGPVLIHWGCATNAELGISYLPPILGAISLFYLTVVVLSGLVLMLALFPSGHGVTPFWDRAIKGQTSLLMSVFLLLNLASPLAYGVSDPNPFALEFLLPFYPLLYGSIPFHFYGLLVSSTLLIIYRYRTTHEAERRQMRWLVFGAISLALSLAISIVFPAQSFPDLYRDFVQAFYIFIFFAMPPAGVSLAILQHRLWDIDVIIRRTLQYSVLTGLLALVYYGLVVIFQGVFSTISNQQSPIFIVISTLVIAALFNPLRLRVQTFIDRRFYRRKYDAQKVLAEFAATARDETDLDRLAARLVEVADETMQPENASVWLKSPSPQSAARLQSVQEEAPR